MPEDSEDIYRAVKKSEFPHAPDFGQCKIGNPGYYKGCIKKIFPIHSQCREDIREVEHHLFTKLDKKLREAFRATTSEHQK